MKTIVLIWILSASAFFQPNAEGRIVIKQLKHKDFPGQCYPVGVREGRQKAYKVISLKPGESAKDPNTCGLTVCMNEDGEAYVFLCAMYHSRFCGAISVDTFDMTLPYPHCCWHCVYSMTCKTTLRPFIETDFLAS